MPRPEDLPLLASHLCFKQGAPWRQGPLGLTVLCIVGARRGLPSVETVPSTPGCRGVGQNRSLHQHAHTPYVPISTDMHRANSGLSSSSLRQAKGG